MKKAVNRTTNRELLKEYDFSRGKRGKYARRYAEGSNVIVLPPDWTEVFPTAESVHEALRGLISLADKVGGKRSRKRLSKNSR
ncbi:MAG: hypothetical protein KY476_08595 [Planctomycetes bacterium]|nr:hypothetical protein [Planctomycetota bacterium]